MKILWPGRQCIFCLQEASLSEEHLIPESLGGDLTCNLICKPCNDIFGSDFEARAKTDPAIRLAAQNLSSEIPNVYKRIEEGQQYFSQSGPARVQGIFRGGAIEPRTFRHVDGSLTVPSDDAPRHIERMLIRRGHDTEFVLAAMTHLASLPEGQRVEVAPGISVINWPTGSAKPDLSGGTPLSELVVVKIAFEFLALMSGTAIYNDCLQLNDLRRVLTGGGESSSFNVERLLAPTYAPFHGICFEGNDPYVRIQVRLFGKLAYRVHFRYLALQTPKIVYTHDLKSDDHHVHTV